MIIILSYLPWTIIDSWKYNTSLNYYVRLTLLDSQSQFFTFHAIFNYCAYTQRVDQIIFYKSSPFSIRDVTFWGTLPMPQALKPNIYNSCSKANLTNVGFGNGGHCFVRVTSLSHSCCALARMQLATFWSFRLCTAMAFPKIQTFTLTWFWCQRPPTEIEGLLGLAFSAIKPCTSFKCLVNNHLTQYVTVQVPTLHFHFDRTFVYSLSFRAKLGG